jgi:hypothetical protein
MALPHPTLQGLTKAASSGANHITGELPAKLELVLGIEKSAVLCNDSYSHLKGVAS